MGWKIANFFVLVVDSFRLSCMGIAGPWLGLRGYVWLGEGGFGYVKGLVAGLLAAVVLTYLPELQQDVVKSWKRLRGIGAEKNPAISSTPSDQGKPEDD